MSIAAKPLAKPAQSRAMKRIRAQRDLRMEAHRSTAAQLGFPGLRLTDAVILYVLKHTSRALFIHEIRHLMRHVRQQRGLSKTVHSTETLRSHVQQLVREEKVEREIVSRPFGAVSKPRVQYRLKV